MRGKYKGRGDPSIGKMESRKYGRSRFLSNDKLGDNRSKRRKLKLSDGTDVDSSHQILDSDDQRVLSGGPRKVRIRVL